MKKLLSIILVLGIMMSMCTFVSAETDKVTVTLDGTEVIFPDAQPFVDVRDRTLVPIRFVSEAMGAKVDWENDTRTVVIQKDEDNIRYTIGQPMAYLNGEMLTFDSYGILKESRTFVPLRFIAEMLSCDVDWNDSTKTVVIKSAGEAVKFPEPQITVHYPESKDDKRMFWINYTNLKEGWLVRYADDFKIVCKNYNDAKRWYHSVRLWLKEQLGLEISEEKSKIVNLRKNYSEFLGLKVKAVRKGIKPKCKEPTPRFVVESHINDKALERISNTANGRIHDIIEAGSGESLLSAVGRYNAFVMGMHNYYQMATHVCKDVNRIDYQVFRTFEKRTHTKLKRYTEGNGNRYIKDRYGKSKRLKVWRGLPLIPISYVQTRPPLLKRVTVNQYTPEGREHKKKIINALWQ